MTIVPLDVSISEIDLSTHSLTGWPDKAVCEHCGGELVLLVATYEVYFNAGGYEPDHRCKDCSEVIG
jgi:hypothetical protein